MRNLGSEIDWKGCDLTPPNEDSDIGFIDHKCNVIEDLEDMNCKKYSYEKDEAVNETLNSLNDLAKWPNQAGPFRLFVGQSRREGDLHRA